MYEKLCKRLSEFYLNQEKIRLCGLSAAQQQEIRKSGYSYKQRVELHKSLRAMLLQIVGEKDLAMKERQLDETYRWYIDKLIAMGSLTEEMKQQEFQFLNPNADSLQAAMRSMIKNKVLSVLCNDQAYKEYRASMFEPDPNLENASAKRSVHPEIPPADVRIKQYRTKNMSTKNMSKKIPDLISDTQKKDQSLIKQREG